MTLVDSDALKDLWDREEPSWWHAWATVEELRLFARETLWETSAMAQTHLRNRVAMIEPGSTAMLTIVREGREKKVQVTIAEQPSGFSSKEPAGATRKNPLEKFGLTLLVTAVVAAISVPTLLVRRVRAHHRAHGTTIFLHRLRP